MKLLHKKVDRKMPIGAELVSGGVHFRVWAPRRKKVEVVFEGPDTPPTLELEPEPEGYFSGLSKHALAGMLYRLRVDDGASHPDPASRFQIEGPFGPSMIVDPAMFAWSDQKWQGVRLKGQVVYEMHIGTFTPEGTWAAAIAQLAELAEVGITLLEVMPVTDFVGKFGWGYDGVNMFAPTRLYGTADDLRRFVDAAHNVGLGVMLDVVYNHIGTVGDFLSEFSPDYYTTKYKNDWGAAINYDGHNSGSVREFFVSNAEYWIREFHVDGFRLDATQSIHDDAADNRQNIMAVIGQAARAAAHPRHIVIMAENEPQESRIARPLDKNGFGLDALWNDDFHHSAMVRLTGRTEAYYTDYVGNSEEFTAAIKWGYLFQGQYYRWQKKRRGTPAFGIPSPSFVAFIQNHDQVANSGRGERLHQITSPGLYRAMTGLLLLSPQTPLLFQGQEFAASTPFLYFCDHEPHHALEILKGRARELSQFASLATEEMQQQLHDPDDPQTFLKCKLDFSERQKHGGPYAMHRDLLKLRREDPRISAQDATRIEVATMGHDAFIVRYFGDGDHERGDDRLMVVNFGRDVHSDPCPQPLIAPPEGCHWEILWSSEHPRYGGGGTPPIDSKQGWRMPGETTVLLKPVRQE